MKMETHSEKQNSLLLKSFQVIHNLQLNNKSNSGKGVSGSDKTNETESPNRTKPKKYPTLFGSVWNRSEPIETDVVWFGSWFFISRYMKPMNQSDDNHTPYFTNIILLHTNLWLDSKLNIKYFLIHSLSLIFISSVRLFYFY
jgi:hypothetical protein